MEELLPEITELYQLNLVCESVNGDLDTLKEDFKDLKPIEEQAELPKANIFEKYKIWKTDFEDYLEREFEDDDFDIMDNLFNEEEFQRLIMHNEDESPIEKQKEPGRNDPCPCGSGKKYKKCCLNKK
ncbi:SEC-C domain-containing protein [Mesonia sp. JHPTF-M18]|uniref:SEC-C domain-containing protein n=2 Tax=Mesonia aestuariivivens TaxID=2796128 RepID=A0ABS6VZD0_9FLAO|nr:SEC-C domain-containing protein [Mesonia aestuariivivens]